MKPSFLYAVAILTGLFMGLSISEIIHEKDKSRHQACEEKTEGEKQ